MFTLISEFV
jgi:hypothetical protein